VFVLCFVSFWQEFHGEDYEEFQREINCIMKGIKSNLNEGLLVVNLYGYE
jgi:hypothetical protein